ncbi:iron complex transport system ATP-binding protein [Cupriavidus gilardii J11]|uniref:Iron complex transport system ATP-binding protein n=1 Tax=Cupriavidus gilardii J11 TaxID=936133 RepID=A0A562B5U6_9BURK|nr:ABC transporter ATP-binding protein [Cupriavidus gilardii]TWG80260.1 iron complex transport system ATP-binding protein [Cupriavidus gilardii J11]
MSAPAWDLPTVACPRLSVRALALFAGQRRLVGHLDVSVEPGQLWAVIGPNGAGKSTLMSALAGLRAPGQGEVRLDDRPLAELARHAPAQLARQRAYLPQAVHDTFPMSVRDAVRVGRYPHLSGWGWAGAGDEAIVDALLAELDVAHLAERDVMTLSGGERQRVSLAAVLAQQAPLLLLDEPLAHLDLRHQIVVLELLSRLARAGRHAVVLIVHDLNLARRYATHALLMPEGEPCLAGQASAMLTAANCSRVLRTPIVSVAEGGHAALIPDGWPAIGDRNDERP